MGSFQPFRVSGAFALFLALALVLVPLAARAQSPEAINVAIVRFHPVTAGTPSDVGTAIADSLVFELHDGKHINVFTRAETEDALARAMVLDPGEPLSPKDALRLGALMLSQWVVFGSYQKSARAFRVNVLIASVADEKLYKLKLTGKDLIEVQDTLAEKVRTLLVEGVREKKKAVAAAKKKPEPEPKSELEPEPDPLAAKIAGMSQNERERAAVQEFNLGVRLGDDSDEERKHYERAIRYNPDFARARLNLGIIAYRHDEWDVAIENLRAFVELAPEDADVPAVKRYISDAEARLAKEALAGADVKFTPTLKQRNWSGREWFNAALEKQEDEPSVAIEYYRQAVRANPELFQAHYNLGTLLYNRDELQEAANAFADYLETAPDTDPDIMPIRNLMKHLPKPEKK